MALAGGSLAGGPGVRAENDTIIAVSTAPGAGAIGIVRLSGPEAVCIAQTAFVTSGGCDLDALPSHSLTYGHVVDQASGRLVDEALLAVMRAPRSYTREDIIEIHCHGGAVAVRSVLQLLVGLGARIADPGEFTRRAFINGRIDLAQAESVAAIVAARSGEALRASVQQLAGGLSERLRGIRTELIAVLATIEANVDFCDEDVERVDWGASRQSLERARERLDEVLKTALLGRALQHGVRTAIVGRPNSGKSSLLNALVLRERAIVSDVPGTTRDTVEDELEVRGIPIRLVDTAGLRHDGQDVESLGIERSLQALAEADLVLMVVDLTAGVAETESELIARAEGRPCIVVGNKTDVVGRGSAQFAEVCEFVQASRTESQVGQPSDVWTCEVSARTGEGIDQLRELVSEVVSGGIIDTQEPVLVGERQRLLVREAATRVDEALAGIEEMRGEELVAEDVRAAAAALGRVVGEDLASDLLDEIFGRFCLGK